MFIASTLFSIAAGLRAVFTSVWWPLKCCQRST